MKMKFAAVYFEVVKMLSQLRGWGHAAGEAAPARGAVRAWA